MRREGAIPSLVETGWQLGSRRGVGGCTPQSTFVGRSSWGLLILLYWWSVAKEQTQLRWLKWSGGGMELWSCSVQLLIAASLYWTIAVCWRHTHQCALSCSETFLPSNCWLQPACIEGLLCAWDITTNVLIRALRQSCLVSPRPPHQNQTHFSAHFLCGSLVPEVAFSSAHCSHFFLAQFQIPGRWIAMVELGQILTSRWKRGTVTWVWGWVDGDRCFSYGMGALPYSTSVTVEILCKLNLNLCCFKKLYFKINLEKSCQSIKELLYSLTFIHQLWLFCLICFIVPYWCLLSFLNHLKLHTSCHLTPK